MPSTISAHDLRNIPPLIKYGEMSLSSGMQNGVSQSKDYSFMNRLKSFSGIGTLVFFIFILLLIYSPAVQIEYYYMEDYSFINSPFEHPLLSEIETWLGSGVAGYGVFTYAVYNYAKSAISVRFLGLTGLGILAFLIYKILRLYRVRTEHAFLISILVCTLPSFQVIAAWLSCTPNIPSAIISAIACLLSLKIVSRKNAARSTKVASFFIIISLLVISTHIYHPSAMFYWALSCIPLLVLKDEDFIERWHVPFFTHIALGLISAAVYYLSLRALLFVMKIGLVRRGDLIEITEIPLKLKWFFYCPLNYALNLWNSFPTYTLAGIVGTIIISFFLSKILQAISKKRMDLLRSQCLRLLLITIILFLCYLPNLMISYSSPTSRTLASLTTAICFLSFFGLVNISGLLKFIPGFSADLRDRAVTILLTAIALVAAYHAHNNVNDFAKLHADEYKYVEDAISTEYEISKLSGISEIYVRRPDRKKIIESGFLYDEFGLPTSGYAGYGPPTVIRKALRELGIIELKSKIKFIQGAPDTPIPEGDNVLVIDMTKLDYSNIYNNSITKPQRYCITIPTRL